MLDWTEKQSEDKSTISLKCTPSNNVRISNKISSGINTINTCGLPSAWLCRCLCCTLLHFSGLRRQSRALHLEWIVSRLSLVWRIYKDCCVLCGEFLLSIVYLARCVTPANQESRHLDSLALFALVFQLIRSSGVIYKEGIQTLNYYYSLGLSNIVFLRFILIFSL